MLTVVGLRMALICMFSACCRAEHVDAYALADTYDMTAETRMHIMM
jgi:hypothetical protein